jgi:hypothetical protein
MYETTEKQPYETREQQAIDLGDNPADTLAGDLGGVLSHTYGHLETGAGYGAMPNLTGASVESVNPATIGSSYRQKEKDVPDNVHYLHDTMGITNDDPLIKPGELEVELMETG